MIIVMDENELHLLDVERRNLNILVQQILVVQMESKHFHHLNLMMKLILSQPYLNLHPSHYLHCHCHRHLQVLQMVLQQHT